MTVSLAQLLSSSHRYSTSILKPLLKVNNELKHKSPISNFKKLKMYFKNKILVKTQLTKLKDHKYSCTNESVLDPYLQPYWNWLVTQIPWVHLVGTFANVLRISLSFRLSVAPNLLTIVGLIINIVTSIILLSYSPEARAEAPSWTYACCAIGLFIYQSLDAIDGSEYLIIKAKEVAK